MKKALVLLALVCLSQLSSAKRIPLQSECPAKGGDWAKYMKTPDRMFGVEFRYAKLVADPDAIGNLKTNFCYVGMYIPNKKVFESAQLHPPPVTADQNAHNLLGNPDDNEVNIHGVVFLFDNNGVLFDKKGRAIGVMTCFISTSDHCAQY